MGIHVHFKISRSIGGGGLAVPGDAYRSAWVMLPVTPPNVIMFWLL